MAWKFRKTFKVAPGVKLSVGRKSASLSVGPKGLKHSINTKGEIHRTTSIPGTGLYNRERIGNISSTDRPAQNATQNNPLIITDAQLQEMSPKKKRFYRRVCYFGAVIMIPFLALFWMVDVKFMAVVCGIFTALFVAMSRRYK